MARRHHRPGRRRIVDVGRERVTRAWTEWRRVGARDLGPTEELHRRGHGVASGHRPHDLLHVARPEHRVDLRDFGPELVSIALGEAAGHNEPFAGAGLLVPRHLENRVDRFLFGRLDERARIDHQHVRVGRIGRDDVSSLLGQSQHHLGVHEVLRAPEGEKTDLHGFVIRRPLSVVRVFGEYSSLERRSAGHARVFTDDGRRTTNNYGYNRYNILGKGIVSRTCSIPQIQLTIRSMPIPNPLCGTEP